MTRATSRAAYEHLVNNRLLVGKQQLIIDRLVHGDATSGEVLDEIERETTDEKVRASVKNKNAWRARFTELHQRGLIVEAGERECGVTGRRALVWRFTGRTKPLKVKRVARGAKAWKALAMDLWPHVLETPLIETHVLTELADRIRALGGRP